MSELMCLLWLALAHKIVGEGQVSVFVYVCGEVRVEIAGDICESVRAFNLVVVRC